VEALRLLRASPQWGSYSEVVERVTVQNVEVLLGALQHDQYLFTCGVVYALRRVLTLPDLILAKVTELEALDHARSTASAGAGRARLDTFLNTPYWDDFLADAPRTGGNGSVPLG
jgi:hypothetical protein